MSGRKSEQEELDRVGNAGGVIAAMHRCEHGANVNDRAKATEEMIKSFFIAANLAEDVRSLLTPLQPIWL